ncbi:MAG: methyltransferase [Bacteroidales bacterium]|nr:methyltransferase [Bacteroidales bacterium]
MSFRFRQFTIEDEQSTLRVGTDAMLLGSWANPGRAEKILDIGTGCGVLALMMAQRSDATIEAIEPDQSAVTEAKNNFLRSPWASRLTGIHTSLQSFSSTASSGYDFIITNPPWFSNSLKSPSSRINQTRHDVGLTFVELAGIVGHMLHADGCFALILPSEAESRFKMICAANGLFLFRRLVILPKPDLPPNRILLEFKKLSVANPGSSVLPIRDDSGKYTPEYLALTGCYHNF